MRGSELLIYGLVIAGVLLFNYLMQQLTKRVREQEAAAAREAPAPPPEDEVLENIWGRKHAAEPPAPETAATLAPGQRARASSGAPPQAQDLGSARNLFQTPQDLRKAIVTMTVLGPCRALEPPDAPESRR